jgi:hypothetical protein
MDHDHMNHFESFGWSDLLLFVSQVLISNYAQKVFVITNKYKDSVRCPFHL